MSFNTDLPKSKSHKLAKTIKKLRLSQTFATVLSEVTLFVTALLLEMSFTFNQKATVIMNNIIRSHFIEFKMIKTDNAPFTTDFLSWKMANNHLLITTFIKNKLPYYQQIRLFCFVNRS